MNAQVAEGAAHIFFRHVEHAPSRNAAAPDQVQIRVVNVSQATAFCQSGSRFEVTRETQRLDDKQMFPRLLRRVEHLLRIRAGYSHRLFADYMAARTETGKGILLVVCVRCAHGDDVGFLLLQHFIRIHIVLGDPVTLGGFFGGFLADICHCDNLHLVTHGFVGGNMCRVANHTVADDGNLILLHYSYSSSIKT